MNASAPVAVPAAAPARARAGATAAEPCRAPPRRPARTTGAPAPAIWASSCRWRSGGSYYCVGWLLLFTGNSNDLFISYLLAVIFY